MKQVKVTANSVLYVVATDNHELFLKKDITWDTVKMTRSVREALMFDDENGQSMKQEP